MKKFSVHAKDGAIGTVHDLYFDDETWTVRYLVVDTMKWLPGRKVLVSPIGLDNVNPQQEQIEIYATKEEIKNSPDIDTDKPISREQEAELNTYFGWSSYWGGPHLWGGYGYPKPLPHMNEPIEADISNNFTEVSKDNHLRSYKELSGTLSSYNIQAIDDEIGHVSDFLIDDESWRVRYMVVDTKNWLPSKNVLVSPEWITDVNWHKKNISVDLKKETIKNGPEYDPRTPVTREFEDELFSHYNQRPFW